MTKKNKKNMTIFFSPLLRKLLQRFLEAVIYMCTYVCIYVDVFVYICILFAFASLKLKYDKTYNNIVYNI